MKRLAVLVGLLVVFASGYALATQAGPSGASAQDDRTIAVQVKFRPTDYMGQEIDRIDRSEGDVCGYTDVTSDMSPRSKQVVVSDATGTIVGTVDLLDVFNPVVLPAPDDAQPGTVDDELLCVVNKTLSVGDSAFYTFTIDRSYRWTVSSEELADRDWSMLVEFYE